MKSTDSPLFTHVKFSEALCPDKDSIPNKLGGVVRHRHLHLYFQEYNVEKERYGVNSRLRFCFPSSQTAAAATPSPVPGDAVSEAREAEQEAFRSIELILLEMYFLLKASFSRTNFQPYNLPVGTKISGLGALRASKGTLHILKTQRFESSLCPISAPNVIMQLVLIFRSFAHSPRTSLLLILSTYAHCRRLRRYCC